MIEKSKQLSSNLMVMTFVNHVDKTAVKKIQILAKHHCH